MRCRWEIFCFILEVWGGIPVSMYGDKIRANECAIMIGNHCAGLSVSASPFLCSFSRLSFLLCLCSGSLDFASGVIVLARAPGIGTGRCMTAMKSSLKYLPTVGWTHVLQGSLFLQRNWESDHKALSAKLASYV